MSRLRGVKRARARAKRRPDALDRLVVAAISETVDDVHQAARTNIDSMITGRSGLLRRSYRKRVRKRQKTGAVGYLTRAARKKAFYARFVHDGTKNSSAKPFHDLAVAQGAASHARRMKRALRVTTRGSGGGARA